MAEEDLSLDDTDLSTEDSMGTSVDGTSGGSKKRLIIIAIAAAAVLLIGGGVAAYFLLSGDDSENAAPVTELTSTQTEGEAEVVEKPAEVVPERPKGDVVYVNDPDPYLVNIKSGKKSRMMQIKMQFLVRSNDAEDTVKKYLPLIRNNMLDFLSLANADEVNTREGRSALKEGALLTAQETIKEQSGLEVIEMVLFTGFVVQ